ncbi:TMV resistance protein N-like [Neltuma alba]|uniref:TMV resistance protein N-like n=1 Tax=Neltuma alba TaxID=207710 RepID=UPI0010A4F487|nr:TMV resistance protein N-like [Prosopis alba]
MAIQVSSHSFVGKPKYRFDVFLSFRGEDTRHSFAVPLYNALRRKGINVFIDDKKLGKGEKISPTLLKAIDRSRISIILFSSNYATSTWCLDELAHIIRCKNEKNQVVMPIFYKVDPMAVQYQRDGFATAMAAHEDIFRDDPEKVQKWKSALSEAASLSKAWIFEDRNEIGFMERIVKDAYAMLPPKQLHNIGYMVGLEPRVEEVISLLNQSSDRVHVFCLMSKKQQRNTRASFASNRNFYQRFLGKITMIGSVDKGISRIKHRLSHKRVLLVLDDVDEVEQLEQLAGGCDWFGFGSKVIITTRNKQMLAAHNVKKTFEMMKLNEYDSCELFCWHAFHENQPPITYQDMSSRAISYAQGLPLALTVIGSNLANKNLQEWKPILEQYERIPERTIHEILKISYDCLQAGAKRIFLDIACFINEEMMRSIKEIVEACDFGARFYFELLVDKSLITSVAGEDYFFMHDLIRQMGREIVRQEAPLHPEKRSRLWYYEDVLRGCNNIEGIMLDPPQQEKVKWSGMTFEKMNNLRILVIRNVQLSTGPTYLPNNLRWLEWEGYPLAALPKDFSPSELIFLKLPESSFILEEPLKIFTSYVAHLDFSFCQFITEVPDMAQCQCLRILDLHRCHNLIKIHDSLGSLSKLIKLDVGKCTKLSIFPREVKMASLEWLSFRGCTSLEYFPHVAGKMDALGYMSISCTAIKELPPSIGNLSGLRHLGAYSCRSLREPPTSLFMLPNLEKLGCGGVHPRNRKSWMKLMQDSQPIISKCSVKYLSLENCGLLDEELHLILNCFRNLRELYVSWNDFASLPKCIKDCAELRRLDVIDCRRLRDIPELPSKLNYIDATNCTSLTAESLDNLYSQAKKELLALLINVPATTIPDWFNHCGEGGTLSFRVRGNLPRAILAFEVEWNANRRREQILPIFMSINGLQVIKPDFDAFKKDPCKTWHVHARQGSLLLVDCFQHSTKEEQKRLNKYMGLDWNDVELQVMSDSIVKWGVYVYEETNMANVQFKSSHASTASLNQRAMTSPPNCEPPKKLLRTDK